MPTAILDVDFTLTADLLHVTGQIQPVCDLRATAFTAGTRYGATRFSNGECLR